MNIEPFVYAIGSIIAVLLIINLLGKYLSDVFVPETKERATGLYQGGESIKSKIHRYRAENFSLTMFFMILHVIGFMGATIFVLTQTEVDPINWTTIGFGGLLFYTIYLVKKSEGVSDF
ncbi:MAG: hypothetical protein ACXAD7_11780 [Candidatus Kariarchaeaceae archaeon]|jgi:hypothetical protein